jgi:hypothetical protein
MHLTRLIPSRHRARKALALAGIAGSALLGGGALAAPAMAHSDGYVTVAQCTNLSANVTLGPSLANKLHKTKGTVSGTVSGCSVDGTAVSGAGTFTINNLTGQASKTAETLTGTYVVTWPASAGLNATIGTLSINVDNQGLGNYFGYDSTAGAFPGAPLSGQYVIATQSNVNLKTVQTIVSTTPLQIQENLG